MTLKNTLLSVALVGAIGLGCSGLERTVYAQDRTEETGEKKEPEKYSLEWYKQNYANSDSLEVELKRNPTANGYVALGDMLFESGRNHSVLESTSRRALELDPDSSLAYNNLGVFYLCQWKQESNEDRKAEYLNEAQQYFVRATEIDQQFYSALNHLGQVFAIRGNHQRAVEYFKRCIRLEPENWRAYNEKARSEFSLGHKSTALGDFQNALDRNIDDEEIKKSVRDWISYLKK